MSHKKLLTVITAAGTLFTACNGPEEHAALSTKAVPVEISNAGSSMLSGSIDVTGQAEAIHNALISTRMMGSIQKIHVDIGDHVRKGQLLFSIHAADIQARGGQVAANISAAEAALANAQKDYERFSALYKQNSATAKELDNITLQYKAAQAQVEAAKQMRNEVNANMSYASVTAPFDGVITQKMMEEGALASPGIPVLALEQPGELQFTASVSENDINQIHTGDAVRIYIAAINKTIPGTVIRLSESASASGGRFGVKIKPEGNQDGLRSGMFGSITFSTTTKGEHKTESCVTVLESAIVRSHELEGLYTINEKGTAILRWVRTGRKYGNEIEILSGLTRGETYISKANGRLFNGAPVKVH